MCACLSDVANVAHVVVLLLSVERETNVMRGAYSSISHMYTILSAWIAHPLCTEINGIYGINVLYTKWFSSCMSLSNTFGGTLVNLDNVTRRK